MANNKFPGLRPGLQKSLQKEANKSLKKADKNYMKADRIRQKIKDIQSSGPLSSKDNKRIFNKENRASGKEAKAKMHSMNAEYANKMINSIRMGTLKGHGLRYNPKLRTGS